MGDIVMPIGKTGRAYSLRGARASKKVNDHNFKLYRVDGEVVTVAQMLERTGLPYKTVHSAIRLMQRRGELVTWEKLGKIKTKPREATGV